MEFHHLLAIFTFLSLALAVSHGASPPEVYWKSMLPFTPMPKSIKDNLPTELLRRQPNKKNKVLLIMRGSVDKVKPYVYRDPLAVPASPSITINYRDAEHPSQKYHVFFLENELHPGSMIDFPFISITNAATFWPRQVVKSIPFSKNKVSKIFHKFSINPKSKEAEIIRTAISQCEMPTVEGEEKFCATSLESMVDFGISKLGKYLKVMSTETEKETMLQKYKVTTEAQFIGDKDVVCHKVNYPFVLYYCHKLHATVVYSIGLKGIVDGTKVKAVAMCHKDTSKWNPMHLAFQELKVKPGTKSICHFLVEDSIVWVSN